MSLADFILALVILLVLVAMIIPGIIDLIIEIKCSDLVIKYKYMGGSCWGMKGCGKDDCCLRRFCYIYQCTLKPEDLKELESMLEERRRELEMEDKQ